MTYDDAAWNTKISMPHLALKLDTGGVKEGGEGNAEGCVQIRVILEVGKSSSPGLNRDGRSF